MPDLEKYAETFDVKNIVITMVLSALGFLVALTWRDVIKDTIEAYVPAGEGLTYTYIVAIGITLFAVIVTYLLIKIRKADLIPDEYEEFVKKHTTRRAKKIVKKTIKRKK